MADRVMTSDGVAALLRSDAWGSRGILRVCAGLTHEQFHQRFDIGLGSLHDTITHIISTMRRWTDRLAGRTPRPMLHAVPGHPHVSGEQVSRTPGELLSLLDEAERDLLETYERIKGDLSAKVLLDWPGQPGEVKRYTFTRAAVLAHVGSHGYHHRAQCLNMLRRLAAPVPGVTAGYPELSAVDWQAEVECPPEVLRG